MIKEKLKIERNKHSIFIRYLVSFVLVLILPLSCISTYFLIDLNNRLEKQAYQDQQDEFNQISERLDKQFANIVECTQRLESSSNMFQYKLQNLKEFGTVLINDLKSNCGAFNLINNIYIFSTNNDYAYSAYTTYTKQKFIEHISAEKYSLEEYEDFIISISTSMVFVHQQDRILLYYPFKRAGQNTVLIYEIKLSSLNELISSQVSPESLFFGIYNEKGELITQVDNLNRVEISNEISTRLNADATQNINISGVDAILNMRQNQNMGWYYAYIRGEGETAELVIQSNSKLYIAFFIVLVIGSLLVFLFTYLSYRPINKLKSIAGSFMPKELRSDVINSKNELEVIHDIMSSLHNSAQKLTTLEGVNQRAIKQFAVTRTVLGLVKDYSVIRTSFTQLGLLDENEYYFSVLMYISKETPTIEINASDEMDEYIDYLERYPMEGLCICAVNGSERNQIIIIASTDNDSPESYFMLLQEQRKKFAQHFSIQVTLSAGLAYPALDFVSISYMQAITAYEYRSINEYNCSIAFNPYITNMGIDIKYQNLLGYLEKAVNSVNEKDVASTMNYILELTENEAMTVHNSKFFCYSLLKIICTAFYNYKYNFLSKFNEKYSLSMIMSIKTAKDYKEFLQNVCKDTSQFVSEYMELCKTKSLNSIGDHAIPLEDLCEFIKENLSDPMLSVAFLADKFGYSVSYFSKMFKDAYAITIYEYVNNLRMEQAKKLLSSTNDRLELIVSKIGYSDTSSFIRKFKKDVGVTPGDFRKQHEI